MVLSESFAHTHRVTKNLSCRQAHEVKQDGSLPSCFSCRIINKCPSHRLARATLFENVCFVFVVLPFKMVPSDSAGLAQVLRVSGCDVPDGENVCVRET